MPVTRSRSGLLTAGIPLGVKWPDSRAVRRMRHSAARAWRESRRRATPVQAAIGASGYAGHDPGDRGGLGGPSAESAFTRVFHAFKSAFTRVSDALCKSAFMRVF